LSATPEQAWEEDDCVRRTVVIPVVWPSGSPPGPTSVVCPSATCWPNTQRWACDATNQTTERGFRASVVVKSWLYEQVGSGYKEAEGPLDFRGPSACCSNRQLS